VSSATISTEASEHEATEHGEVFTRRWVVDLILDLAGYSVDRDLAALRAVEPSCGHGAFIGPMVQRLSASLKTNGRPLGDAANAIRAFDLLTENVAACRGVAASVLTSDGWPPFEVALLVNRWINVGDYLLEPREEASADVVVGNPPYVRLEDVPQERMNAYRRSCATMGGRADAFEANVSAYPAITVLHKGPQGVVVTANTTSRFGPTDAAAVREWIRDETATPFRNERYEIERLPRWVAGEDLWPAGPLPCCDLWQNSETDTGLWRMRQPVRR
jgi:hypothetical protein